MENTTLGQHESYSKLIPVAGEIGAIVDAMDQKVDTSVGFFFSGAITGAINENGKDKPRLDIKAKLWGNPLGMERILFTMCEQQPELFEVIRKVATRISIKKVRQAKENFENQLKK